MILGVPLLLVVSDAERSFTGLSYDEEIRQEKLQMKEHSNEKPF